MCVLSIKALIRKKSGNLFNDSRIYKALLKLMSDFKMNFFPELMSLNNGLNQSKYDP